MIKSTWGEKEASPLNSLRGGHRPRSVRILATGLGAVEVSRLDAHTLRVRPATGFYSSESEQMVRAAWIPFKVGETVALPDMKVTITGVSEKGRATEAEFRFPRRLESAEWLWMDWIGGRLVPWAPPAPGGRVTLPGLL